MNEQPIIGTNMNIAFIVDGAALEAEGGAVFDRKDPMTGKVATPAAAVTVADVDKVVEAAAKAFESWSETGPSARRALLLKAADLMESRTGDFVKLMLEETGVTAPWAGFNVHLAAGILRKAAALTTQNTGEVIPSDKAGILSMAIRQSAAAGIGMKVLGTAVVIAKPSLRSRECTEVYRQSSDSFTPGRAGNRSLRWRERKSKFCLRKIRLARYPNGTYLPLRRMAMDTDETRQTEWVRAAVDRYAGPLTRYATLITGAWSRRGTWCRTHLCGSVPRNPAP